MYEHTTITGISDSCHRCGRRFRKNQLVKYDTISEQCLCCSCFDEESEGDDFYTDIFDENYEPYVYDRNSVKAVLTKEMYSELSDGVWVVSDINGYLVLEFRLKDFIERSKSDVYLSDGYLLIEKKDKTFTIRFPEALQSEYYDFLDNKAEFERIITYLEGIIDPDDIDFLCNKHNRIAGFTHRGESRRIAFTRSLCRDMMVRSREDIERHENTSIDGVIRRKMRTGEVTAGKFVEFMRQRIRGQGSELDKVSYVLYSYLEAVAENRPYQRDNLLITGPSGTGKTEVCRAFRDYCKENDIPLPVAVVDISQITETGFKGADIDEIMKKLLKENISAGGIGVCFLDEFDKKCSPSFDGKGENVNKNVQGNILTMIEGRKDTVDIDKEPYNYDSSQTLFVMMGSFQEIRNNREKYSYVPFIEEMKRSERDNADTGLDECVSMEEIIQFGMIEELAGRIVQIVNFRHMNESEMAELIHFKVKEIADSMHIRLSITENAVSELVESAYSPLGVRRTLNRIKENIRNELSGIFHKNSFRKEYIEFVMESADKVRSEFSRDISRKAV